MQYYCRTSAWPLFLSCICPDCSITTQLKWDINGHHYRTWRFRTQCLFHIKPLIRDVSPSVRWIPICWILACFPIAETPPTSVVNLAASRNFIVSFDQIFLSKKILECSESWRSGAERWCEELASSLVLLRLSISSMAFLVSWARWSSGVILISFRQATHPKRRWRISRWPRGNAELRFQDWWRRLMMLWQGDRSHWRRSQTITQEWCN